MVSSSEIQTGAMTIWVDANRLVRVRIHDGVSLDLDKAKQSIAAMRTLTNGGRWGVLVDLRGIKALDREARQYYGSDEVNQLSRAIALLGSSRVSMIIANFFISVTNPSIPTRVFNDEAAAIAWLKGI